MAHPKNAEQQADTPHEVGQKAPELPKQSSLPPLDGPGLAAAYREMHLIRRVEELAAKAYTQRKILGFCHLYIGQESVAVGVAASTKEDYWIAAYREHGQAMAKGVSARSMMAELYGKATGSSKGYGGSMHIFDKERRFLGGWGIVGGHVPLATGVGWAIRHRKENKVCVCFFGDGAMHQGAFFEALCLAQLYKLPIVFVCENNYYAMGTPLHRQSAITELSRRAHGVGMLSETFEGFDVEVVRERVARAADFARAGSGPVLLEIITYRYRGHSMSDPAKYRPEGELESKKLSDPIAITARRLREAFGFGDADLDRIHQEVDAEAQDAADFAESSPPADPATLYDFVYAPDSAEPSTAEREG